ncbi:uncharacterized protein LOC135194104 [Vanessa tameamea]|uniref:Uncharacterized protein LOC135194104 n=1 Tax=Vanessa tameamea TaxID=334116 RepID=A0ABM4AU19_VANTA
MLKPSVQTKKNLATEVVDPLITAEPTTNSRLAEIEIYLGLVRAAVARESPKPILVLGDLRATCCRARRVYIRCQRHNGLDTDLEGHMLDAYRQLKKDLQLAISKAKEMAREELLAGLNRVPWGPPYRGVRGKFRTQGAPVTETLPLDLLLRLVGELFSHPGERVPPQMALRSVIEDAVALPLITEREMEMALGRLRAKNTAPGPDRVLRRVLCDALEFLGARLRELFDECLCSGQPIVLLNETDKLFEKVLAAGLIQLLEEVGPGLSEAQYGFRTGRSTIDVLDALKTRTTEAVARGQVVLAVSLDVANAFNILPFDTIPEALRYHGVPTYLRRLLEAYLQDREVLWARVDGRLVRRRVGCGVPQGSVLGPILWNVGFDWLVSPFCYECGAPFDTAYHTLSVGGPHRRTDRQGVTVA